MRIALLVVLAMTTASFAAEPFPAVDKLPANKELPDPLLFLSGKKVETKDQWVKERRPELQALFEHYMYGKAPAKPMAQGYIENVPRKALGDKANLSQTHIDLGPKGCPPIHVLIVTPKKRTGTVPVFLGINFYGNHTVLKGEGIDLPTIWVPDRGPGVKNNKATDAGSGGQADVWNVEYIIDHGYAFVTFYCGDLMPDKNDLKDGVIPHFLKDGQKEPGPHDWATIRAWAWGVSRVIDYLTSAKELGIDTKRIAVVGHSRLGKTALVAAAFDDRIALAIPHQAGCGGTAPSRGKVGESVKQINDRFPHWFCGEFKKFNEQVEKLPFDQHCLVALCAPRPVLFTNATEDTWANPDGQFQVLKAADPVYRFLDAGGLDAKDLPKTGVLVDSKLGYWVRPGKHSMTKEDWEVFVKYADKHLTKK